MIAVFASKGLACLAFALFLPANDAGGMGSDIADPIIAHILLSYTRTSSWKDGVCVNRLL